VSRSLERPTARYLPLLAAALVAAPVLVGAAYAVVASVGLAGPGQSDNGLLDASRWQKVLSSRSTWSSIAWSLYVAFVSTAVATLAAVAVAATFTTNTRADRWARRVATLPLPVPHLVAAASALLVLGQSGLLARVGYAAGLLQTPADMPPLVYDAPGIGLILTLAWKEWPFLALVAIAVRGTIGDTYDEAATGLGARAWTRWRLITWPLLWRGLLPSVIAVFVFALGSYETAVLLAPVQPVPLPVLTMERFADPALARRGDAYVLALLALGIAALAVVVHEWTRARWARVVESSASGTSRA
jgi:putative spermidine/putrescine transport system permease protein